MRQLDPAHRGVQGRKQQVLREHLRAGQCIENTRLSSVGVAHEGDDLEWRGIPPALLLLAGLPHLVDALLQQLDPLLQQPAVALDLGFTRPAEEAEAAALAFEVRP